MNSLYVAATPARKPIFGGLGSCRASPSRRSWPTVETLKDGVMRRRKVSMGRSLAIPQEVVRVVPELTTDAGVKLEVPGADSHALAVATVF